MKEARTELYRLKWFLGQALALLALWTVSALDLARGPVWVAVLALTLAVTLFPRLPSRFAIPWKRFAAPLLIVLFLGDLLLSGRDIIPPMVRLLLVLLAVRAATHRNNREDLQLILLAMFLSVVSGVFTLSMLFAVQAFLFALAAIGLLFLVNLLETGEEGGARPGGWEEFSWREFAGWVRASFDLRMLRSLAVLLLLLMGTTGLLFVAIPRVYLDQAIPFLRLPQAGLSGFNDVIRFGDVTEIREDDGIAMRVDVPAIDAVPANPYWRMLVLDRYDSGTFLNSLFGAGPGRNSAPQIHSLSPFPPRWFTDDAPGGGTWTFYMEGGVSRYLPVLGPFAEMRFQGRQPLQANPQVLVFRIPQATNSVFSYQVEDFVAGPSVPGSSLDRPLLRNGSRNEGVETEENDGNAVEDGYPFTTLGLPVSEEEEAFLRSLLAEILTGEEASVEEKAGRIQAYLQANHRYSLSPGGFGGGDPVVQWLREGRAGHCELFAGAFTLLARAAGIPTRLVVGFSGGSWNTYEDFFVVRNRNAHAWCEVFDGKNWLRFDPTPGSGSSGAVAAGGAAAGFLQESDFRAWLDSLRVMWYRRVINFDDSSQQEIVEGISGAARQIGARIREGLAAFAKGTWEQLSAFGRNLREGGAAWGVVAAMAGVAAVLWWMLRRFPGLSLIRGKQGRLDPLRRRAARELRRMEDDSGDAQDEAWKRAREELLAVRFGRDPDPVEAGRAFLRARRVCRRRRTT